MKRRDSKSVLIRDWVYMLLSAGQLVKMVTQIKHKKNEKKIVRGSGGLIGSGGDLWNI